ncbi:MAG: Sec-independent protein translocase protein TatB [Pseudomonadota bacterium]
MFDIGFAELLLIGIVGLLVIGPERLPGAVRTAAQWLRHFKRSFNSIKHEIQQELEMDAVKTQLDEANEAFKKRAESFKQDIEADYEAKLPGPEYDVPEEVADDANAELDRDTAEKKNVS